MLRKILVFGFVLSIHALGQEGDFSGSGLKFLLRESGIGAGRVGGAYAKFSLSPHLPNLSFLP